MRMVVVRGGLITLAGGGDAEPCERFDFLTGGSSPSATVLGGDGCDSARERLGTMMPSSASESDLRRVLYGIVGAGSRDGRRSVQDGQVARVSSVGKSVADTPTPCGTVLRVDRERRRMLAAAPSYSRNARIGWGLHADAAPTQGRRGGEGSSSLAVWTTTTTTRWKCWSLPLSAVM